MPKLDRAAVAYAAFRIVTGALFACHGAQKLFGVLGGTKETADPEGLIAGIVEFGGGLLVALGLFTVVAAFLASGEMAVAYFKAHAARGFWPIANHGELAVLYCFAFLFVAMHGAGRFGVDRVWRRRGGKAVESNSDLIEHATRWRAFQRQATLSNLTHEH